MVVMMRIMRRPTPQPMTRKGYKPPQNNSPSSLPSPGGRRETENPLSLRGEPGKGKRSGGPFARRAGNPGRLPWAFLRSRTRSKKGARVRAYLRWLVETPERAAEDAAYLLHGHPHLHKFRNLWHSFTQGVSCNTNTSDTA